MTPSVHGAPPPDLVGEDREQRGQALAAFVGAGEEGVFASEGGFPLVALDVRVRDGDAGVVKEASTPVAIFLPSRPRAGSLIIGAT